MKTRNLFIIGASLIYMACGNSDVGPGEGPGLGNPSRLTASELLDITLDVYITSFLAMGLNGSTPVTLEGPCPLGGKGNVKITDRDVNGVIAYTTEFAACSYIPEYGSSSSKITLTGDSSVSFMVDEAYNSNGPLDAHIHYSVSSSYIGYLANCDFTILYPTGATGKCTFTGSDGVTVTMNEDEIAIYFGPRSYTFKGLVR